MTEGLASEAHVDVQLYSDNSKINGMLDTNLGGKPSVDSAGISLLSSPSLRSFSPSRYVVPSPEHWLMLVQFFNFYLVIIFCLC